MSAVRTRYPAQQKLSSRSRLQLPRLRRFASSDLVSHHFPTTPRAPTTSGSGGGAAEQITVTRQRNHLPERHLDLHLRDRAVALRHLLGEVAADAALDETVDRRPSGEVLEGPAHRLRCHLLAEREVLAHVLERLVEHGR